MGNKAGRHRESQTVDITRKPGKWMWQNNEQWQSFDTITSKEIDDSLQYLWTHSVNNHIMFPLTSGAFFSQQSNVYQVHVYLDDTRIKISNIYQLNTNTNFQRKMKRQTSFTLERNAKQSRDIYTQLCSMGFDAVISKNASFHCATVDIAIEYISKTTILDDKQQRITCAPLNISTFETVDNKTRCLVSGYFRRMENKLVSMDAIPQCVYQICCIFCYDAHKIDFQVGGKIDARDRWGKWYIAGIRKHKKAKESLNKALRKTLSKQQQKEIDKLQKLEAIFVKYVQWEEKWAEWIFIEKDTICSCDDICVTDKTEHRLAPSNTQSEFRQRNKNKTSNFKTTRGTPENAGCVFLISTMNNDGGIGFMTSIVQCMSHTPELVPYFITRKYELDINTSSKLVREFANLLMDIWSNNYTIIKPDSLLQVVLKHAPQFNESKSRDPVKFLDFLLGTLHDELNAAKVKPGHDANIEMHSSLGDRSWASYLKQNKSKIAELFHGLYKSTTTCTECNNEVILFKPYTYLSVPVSKITFIVDVIHREQKHHPEPNKPFRHIIHIDALAIVQDLANMIADIYKIKPEFVVFYQNLNMVLAREYKNEEQLSVVVDQREAMGCYILREPIAKDSIQSWTLYAKVCHSAPRTVKTELFGIPFLISFGSMNTRADINKIVYERLYLWIGSNILLQPSSLLWDSILDNLPFILRFTTNDKFDLNQALPETIPCDNIIFAQLLDTCASVSVHIIVEWKESFYDLVKVVLNKVVVTTKYSAWKKRLMHKTTSDEHMFSIYECMNEYLHIDNKADIYCDKCKQRFPVTIERELWCFPDILIIHLNRNPTCTTSSAVRYQSSQVYVACPVDNLDLSRYAVNKSIETRPIYDLYATVNTHSRGHSCFVNNIENDEWYQLGIPTLESCAAENVIGRSTTILFYKKRKISI